MRSITFWALDATVLFALSLVYFNQGYHRRNAFFAVWLCNGVIMQLIGAWALAAGPPPWIDRLRLCEDVLTYGLTAGILIIAAIHRDCPVNRSILWGVSAMVALNALCRFMGVRVDHSAQIWLRNVAFFGPAIFLLLTLSNLRFDMLPLWIKAPLENAGMRWAAGAAAAAVVVAGAVRARRH
jgi:uncharacterized membrane protein YhaH (DUF805 family)